MSRVTERVEAALSSHLGEAVRIRDEQSVGGGCINEALSVETSHGGFFVKVNGDPVENLFTAEAEGLRAMRASGTSLVIPEVVAWEDPAPGAPGFIVLERLSPGRRTPSFTEDLGRGLAELHRHTSEQGFGFEIDTYCGTTLQPNRWRGDWIAFYREQRLGHQLRLLVDLGRFSKSDRAATEQLLGRLEDRLAGPEAPPAMIHGDLWSGNLHVAPDGRPSIIDPAAYFGHREAELGMMTLFGGFGPKVFDAYEEAWPLPGWRERNPLYELYHVMNHATLFGGGYVSQARSIIRRFS